MGENHSFRWKIRTPMIALADVGVAVTNAKVSAQWWKDKVGFHVFTLGGEDGHAVMVAPPGDRFVLHLCEGFERVDPGNTGIAFVTDEIQDWVARMEKNGVKFPQPLARAEWGGHAKFEDPDGNVFWLVEGPRKLIRDTVANVAPDGAGSGGRKAPRKAAKRAGGKPAKKPAKKATKKATRRAPRKSSSRGRTASRSRR